jgi:hypothetical protein
MEAQQQLTARGKRSGAARRKLKKEKQALLDAQIANLEIGPTKGWKLPPELVYWIVDLAAFLPPPVDGRNPRARQRRAFLLSASLVCRQWREEAQRHLWKAVFIRSDEGAQSFLLGASKGYKTWTLDFLGDSQLDDDNAPQFDGGLVERVLGATHCHQGLYLARTNNLRPEALCQSFLAGESDDQFSELDVPNSMSVQLPGLGWLRICRHVTFTAFTDPRSPPRPPYRLEDLLVELCWDVDRTMQLISMLLVTSTDLATLRLVRKDDGELDLRRPPSSLHTLAASPSFSRLVELDLKTLGPHDLSCAAALFRLCTSLKRLRYNGTDVTILNALGSQISELAVTVRLVEDYEYQDEIQLLCSQLWCVLRLRKLEVFSSGSPRGCLALERECMAKGVECVWMDRE